MDIVLRDVMPEQLWGIYPDFSLYVNPGQSMIGPRLVGCVMHGERNRVVFTVGELEARIEFDGGKALAWQRYVEACERIWSRWMAL